MNADAGWKLAVQQDHAGVIAEVKVLDFSRGLTQHSARFHTAFQLAVGHVDPAVRAVAPSVQRNRRNDLA